MRQTAKRLVLRLIATRPIQFFLSHILPRLRLSIAPPKMTGIAFVRFTTLIKPGDLVFSSDPSKLSSVMIPGIWDHVGIVNNEGMIVEAHFPKVRKIHPFDFCHTSDFVGILRPFPVTADMLATKVDRFIGRNYDTLFRKGAESLYCSELVWECDESNSLGFDVSDAIGLGIEYLSPDGLWDSSRHRGRIVIDPKANQNNEGQNEDWL